jgi:hypothetical protein
MAIAERVSVITFPALTGCWPNAPEYAPIKTMESVPQKYLLIKFFITSPSLNVYCYPICHGDFAGRIVDVGENANLSFHHPYDAKLLRV